MTWSHVLACEAQTPSPSQVLSVLIHALYIPHSLIASEASPDRWAVLTPWWETEGHWLVSQEFGLLFQARWQEPRPASPDMPGGPDCPSQLCERTAEQEASPEAALLTAGCFSLQCVQGRETPQRQLGSGKVGRQLEFSSSRTLAPPTRRLPKRKAISLEGSAAWFHRSRWAFSAPPPLLYFLEQVSVLTDQVEAQGEKIRDLEVCLEGHQVKLNAAEEMLQQVKGGACALARARGFQSSSCIKVTFCVHVTALAAYFPILPGGGLGRSVCGVYTAGETSRTESQGGESRKDWPERNNLLGRLDRFPGGTFSRVQVQSHPSLLQPAAPGHLGC